MTLGRSSKYQATDYSKANNSLNWKALPAVPPRKGDQAAVAILDPKFPLARLSALGQLQTPEDMLSGRLSLILSAELGVRQQFNTCSPVRCRR